MNYLPKNRFKHPYFKRILVLTIIFIAGAVFFSFLDGIVISVAAPVWKGENIIVRNLRNGMTWFGSQRFLSEENRALKEELSSLELKSLSLSEEQTQKNILLELLGRKLESKAIVAAVLTHPTQTPYDIIVIDAGSDDSIVIDSEVFLPEGPILGKVSELFPRKAKVKLFSASGEKTNAVLERNNVPITLVGAGGGNFTLALPHDVAIEKGDKIFSAGIVPSLLATVWEISVKPTDSFKEVLANSPANIFTIRFVFVTP